MDVQIRRQMRALAEAAEVAEALSLSAPTVDTANTEKLRAYKKLAARSDNTLTGSIESAGYYAKKFNKTMFVYLGNSYGHAIWRVSYKKGDYLNGVNNTGAVMYSVDPDLTISKYDVVRPHLAAAEKD